MSDLAHAHPTFSRVSVQEGPPAISEKALSRMSNLKKEIHAAKVRQAMHDLALEQKRVEANRQLPLLKKLDISLGFRASQLHLQFRDPKPVWLKQYRLQRGLAYSLLPRGNAYRIGDTRYGLQFIDSIYWSLILVQDLMNFVRVNDVSRKSINDTRDIVHRLIRVSRPDGVASGLLKSVLRQCAFFLRNTTHRGFPKAETAMRSPMEITSVLLDRSQEGQNNIDGVTFRRPN